MSPRLCCLFALLLPLSAEDWPEWRGQGRLGQWTETGILDRFPAAGLDVKWRTPVRPGFAGPAVSRGRVFLTDYRARTISRGTERAIGLDERTGRILWEREWEADYSGLGTSYAIGPRATPTVDGDRVYVLGAKGALLCLKVADGAVVWSRDFVRDYRADIPTWGSVAAPIVDGARLIALVGGADNAKVVAFDKMTGREIWRALAADSEPGYSAPVIYQAGGRRQLIVWHATALVSLDPEKGEIYWQQPFNARLGLAVATAVREGPLLLVSSFYTGSLMMELAPSLPTARMLWKGTSESETNTDGLHALINTPVIRDGYVYGIDSYGQFRCLNARTGERVWETLAVTRERARWAAALMVENQDRYFINNDRGELIIARLTPQKYDEIARTRLIQPTSRQGVGRRESGAVNWSHPAYANRHIFARNDEELICASLEKK
jgi:outer membrane protein assembly factor BamB